jgi:Zn-dependent protease with chaperone function
MTIGCLTEFLIDPGRFLLVLLSVSFAIVLLIVLKKGKFSTKSRVMIIYGHLTSLVFPFVLYATHFSCSVMCMPCSENMLHLLGYALPTTLLLGTLGGFIAIPVLFRLSSKRSAIDVKWIINFVKKQSNKMNIKVPKLYVMDNAKPAAFSFRSLKSAIFMSVGMFEVMNKQEIKAIILHELAHIRQKSSILKFSNSLLRVISPLSILARFNQDSSREEEKADEFVVEAQGTDKHLLSAKRKLDAYESVLKGI